MTPRDPSPTNPTLLLPADRPKGWWRTPLDWTVTVWSGVRPPRDPAEESRRLARRQRRRQAHGTHAAPAPLPARGRMTPKNHGLAKKRWTMTWRTRDGVEVTVRGHRHGSTITRRVGS